MFKPKSRFAATRRRKRLPLRFKVPKWRLDELPKWAWGDGPWQDEPDTLKWTDEATHLECLIKRSPFTGSLCGYVGLSEGHPLYGKNYDYRIPLDDVRDPNLPWEDQGAIPILLEAWGGKHGDGRVAIDVAINVHGSITFMGFWRDQDDGLWYAGFDTGHYDDFCPGMIAGIERRMGKSCGIRQYGTYKTLDYVQGQCRLLAAQLKELDRE